MIISANEWGEARVLASAEVISAPALTGPHLTPNGLTHLTWIDGNGLDRLVDIVAWRRLDQGPWEAGQEFEIVTQGRSGHDLRLPLHTATARLVLTLNPADTTEVLVGQPQRAGGWVFGVRLCGVRPAGQRLPTRRPVL